MLHLAVYPDAIVTTEHIQNASWKDQDGVKLLVHNAQDQDPDYQGTPFGCVVRGKVIHHEQIHDDFGLLLLAPGDKYRRGFFQSKAALRQLQDLLPYNPNMQDFIHESAQHMCFTTILSVSFSRIF